MWCTEEGCGVLRRGVVRCVEGEISHIIREALSVFDRQRACFNYSPGEGMERWGMKGVVKG